MWLCFAWPGGNRVAQAAEQTLSVLGLEAVAGTPDTLAAAITEAMRQRVAGAPGYRLVPGRDLVEVKLVFSCPDEAPQCIAQAAQSIGASKVIFGNVQPVSTDAYLVTLKLLDAERGMVDTWISEQVTKAQANPVGLRAPVQKWFATLTRQSLPGSIKVTGGVVGAAVWLDGAQAGLLGNEGLTIAGVTAGQHQIAVSKTGYEKFERTLTLGSGATEKLAVQLKPIGGVEPPAAVAPGAAAMVAAPAEPEAPAPPHMGARVTGWALLGVGLVGIGFGGYSSWKVSDINSSLDQYRRYPCASAPNQRTCSADGKVNLGEVPADKISYINSQKSTGDTYTALQWVGYGVGAAAVIAGGALLYYGYFSKPDTVASSDHPHFALLPTLAPNAAGATALLTF